MHAIISVLTDEYHDNDFKKVCEHVATVEELDHVALRKVWGKELYELEERQLHEIRDTLRGLGLKVSSISGRALKIPWWGPPEDEDVLSDGTPVRTHERNLFSRYMDVADLLGTRVVRTFGFNDLALFAEMKDDIWADWVETMKAFCAMARERGMTIALENASNQVVSTAESIERAFAEINDKSLRLLFDPSNLLASGDVYSRETFESLKEKVVAIHVRDATVMSRDPYNTSWVMLGTGEIPWGAIIEDFSGSGFAGPWTIEPHLGAAGGWDGTVASVQKCKEILGRS